jgi:diacylglycerol kinase family enzyme
VAVISNRNSGHNRDNFETVAATIARCQGIQHFATSSSAELPEILRTIAARQPDILAINGGDGTAATLFGLLLENPPFATLPTLALLPGGTANMTASDVGVKGDLVRATERLCQWCATSAPRTGQLVQRHVLRVHAGASEQAHFGMFFGAGAVIQGTEYAHRNIHSKGLRDDFSVGLGAARTLWGIVRGDPQFDRPLPVTIRLDDAAPQTHDLRILAVSTLGRLFLGFHPFWGQEQGALKLSFVTRNARRLLWRFPGLLRGRPGAGTKESNGYFSHNSSRLQLTMEGSFNLDGEIIAAHPDNGSVTITPAGPLTFLKLP